MLGTSPFCIWASANLSRVAKAWKGRGTASWLFVCMSCLSVWSHGSLSLFPSSLLSLSLFLFFYSSFLCISLLIFFLSLFWSKSGLTPSWYKDTLLDGWNLTLSDFPDTWTFVWKSSAQCWGLLSSVFPLWRASKCSVDAVHMFLGIVCLWLFLILTWNG